MAPVENRKPPSGTITSMPHSMMMTNAAKPGPVFRAMSHHTACSSSTADWKRRNDFEPMFSALMTRMPRTYSPITAFIRDNAALARGITPAMRLKMTPITTNAAANGTSVASASGTFTEHRKMNAATGPVRYMIASVMLWARNSSSFSMSSDRTVLMEPVDRSSSCPSGACARWSTTRHRTRNSVLYAPLCDSAPAHPKHAYWMHTPTATTSAFDVMTSHVQVPS